MLFLDHITIAGLTLAAATDHVSAALGVTPRPGGEHAVFHTHNTLMGLGDGLYLEAIAANPDAPQPTRPRWFDLDRFEGPPRLTNWICRTDNLDAALARLPRGFGDPVDLQRGSLRWRMAVPQSGILPYDNCAPALIEWQTDTHPASMLAPSGCTLKKLEVRHPEAKALNDLLAPFLDDARIGFATGPANLLAQFDTPTGAAQLT